MNETSQLYAEDLLLGSRIHLGTYSVTKAEVLEFARRWDDLPIHTDPDEADAGPFGGLIASGVHTMAMNQHLMAKHFVSRLALVAGKGIREMKLENPVRPGDTLESEVEIVSIELRGRRADLTTRAVMTNQQGLPVLDMTGVTVISRRHVHAHRP